MKKRVLALMMLFLVIGLFGCAKTQATDVFRFEVRELEMTLYADETKNIEKELGLIKGDVGEDADIVYTMSYVEGKNANQTCYINETLELANGEEYSVDGIIIGTVITDGSKIKVKAIGEGKICLTAYLKDSPNVTDSIIITVTKEKLSGLKITVPDGINRLYFGQTVKLEVVTFPSHIVSEFNFRSSNSSFASVDNTGLVKAIVPSANSTETNKEVIITATSKYDSSLSASYKFTLTYEAPKDVIVKNGDDVISKDQEIELLKGSTLQITTKVESEKGFANQKVTYKSSDTKVATITDAGLITAVNGGTAKIDVTTSDGTKSTSFTVVVGYSQSTELALKFDNKDITTDAFDIILDKKYNFSAVVSPVESANQNVKITVPEEYKDFVEVNDKDLSIKPIKVGEFKVIVSTLDENSPITKEVSFKVDYDTPSAVNIKNEIKQLVVGEEEQLNVAVTPSGAKQEVLFTSSDATIASVDENGLVKALKAGTVTITVTSKENSELKATCSFTVYEKATSFTISGATNGQTVKVDEAITITVTVQPAGAFVKAVNATDDSDCFDISINDLVITLTAYEAGTANITISIEGLESIVISLTVVE